MTINPDIRWHYIDNQQQKQGPFTSEQIKQCFQIGLIAPATLLWHKDLTQWLPLQQFTAQLDLANTSADNAILYEMPPPPTRILPAYQHQPAPKQGLSGCAIIAIVLGALSIIPLIAILAGIGIPLYQDNIQKARVSKALTSLEPLKYSSAAFLKDNGRCPTHEDHGFGQPESYATTEIATVTFGESAEKHCDITAVFTISLHSPDEHLYLQHYSDGNWSCSSNVVSKYLPPHCK